jgi:hypothetical protein
MPIVNNNRYTKLNLLGCTNLNFTLNCTVWNKTRILTTHEPSLCISDVLGQLMASPISYYASKTQAHAIGIYQQISFSFKKQFHLNFLWFCILNLKKF